MLISATPPLRCTASFETVDLQQPTRGPFTMAKRKRRDTHISHILTDMNECRRHWWLIFESQPNRSSRSRMILFDNIVKETFHLQLTERSIVLIAQAHQQTSLTINSSTTRPSSLSAAFSYASRVYRLPTALDSVCVTFMSKSNRTPISVALPNENSRCCRVVARSRGQTAESIRPPVLANCQSVVQSISRRLWEN